MLKRPLKTHFREKVLKGIKTTTLRDTPWPIGKPIMLYSWSGKPYRSKQDDLVPVEVLDINQVVITHFKITEMIVYWGYTNECWHKEGFDSQKDMDNYFKSCIKPGKNVTKYMMTFKVIRDWKADEK